MKKLSLVALLSVLTIGALVGCGNTSSSSSEAPSSSEQPSSSEVSSESSSEEVAQLPVAWEEGETYQALECSVSLVPGSLADKNDATITNANAKAVKDFMNDANVRCFDLRDVSEGYGLGHIEGFESVSYFKTIVGKDNQLFSQNEDGTYTARYKESEDIIYDIFPQDATLFVMCQVGGRVQPFLKLLDQLDYDMSKVYNIGGWNQIKDLEDFGGYDVSLGIAAKEITYDFSGLKLVDSTAKASRRSAMPAAWEEGETYQALECSVSLVPGSLADKNDATITNANAKPVSDYLADENVRFFDLRDVSEGYGLGHIQGFETVSYFKTIVGKDNQLFSQNEDGTYTARYKESEDIIYDIFPQDATLFVMCQVGGRVQPFLKLLDQLDYDMSKVYNIGGWNQIKDLEDFGGYGVSLGIAAKTITYDFSTLKPVNA